MTRSRRSSRAEDIPTASGSAAGTPSMSGTSPGAFALPATTATASTAASAHHFIVDLFMTVSSMLSVRAGRRRLPRPLTPAGQSSMPRPHREAIAQLPSRSCRQ